MRTIIVAVSAAITCAASASAATSEWSARPAVPGFAVGFERGNAEQSIVEQVPQGETVERWTRMLTSQRFVGRASDPGPGQMLVNIQGLLADDCPGGSTTQIVAMSVNGRPAARMRSDCPLNRATGLPETFFIVAFAGESDLFSEQVAFRRVPTAADVKFATDVLQSLSWCRARTPGKACARPH